MAADYEQLIRGAGRFVDDRAPADALHLAVLRSPVAHGRITRLSTEAARRAPGVRAVLTAAELAARGIRPLGTRAPLEDAEDGVFHDRPRPVLAGDVVRHVGEPVAAVVADDAATAADALEAVELDIAPRDVAPPPPADGEEETRQGRAETEVAFRWAKGDAAAATRAFERADRVVALTVRHPRVAAAPLEPRVAVAAFTLATGRYTLWTPSQGVLTLRGAIAESLGVDAGAMRVVTEDVGGSFAVKI